MTALLPDRETAMPGSAWPGDALAPNRHRLAVPRWWRDAIGVLTWASMLVVVTLWVAGGGLQAMGTLGGFLIGLGRISGLVSADLLLIQVLLMARIPAVERVYGQDELARRHRLVGFTSVNLLLAHIVTTIVGYAVTYHENLIAELWDVVVTYPGMLLAVAGTGLLLMVAVTSMRRARAKLRYESWHLLHLYAYLGLGLTIPHMVWTGGDFVSSPLARLYWWSLYAAALAAVLVCRVGLPLWRSRSRRLIVERVIPEGPGVVSVIMRGRNLRRFAGAGQFFNWRFLDRAGWTRANPYSLSAPPTLDRMRITVKNLGDGSASLARLQPGTRVLVEGPYGRLHGGVRTRPRATLIASGIGITPLRALLEESSHTPGEVTLIYRASRAEDLIFKAELDDLAGRTGARVFYVVGHRIAGRDSWLPQSAAHLSDADALRQLVPDIADQDVYICGAEPWMDAVERAALACRVPAEQLHTERFSW